MRWFKHLTSSGQDEKMILLKDEFGMEGYGVYWTILEHIASQISASKPQTFLELSPKSWRKITDFSPKKFQLFAVFCSEISLFSVEFLPEKIRIDCPNLLKYLDEYSKKSGVTPEFVRIPPARARSDTDKDTDTDKEEEKENMPISAEIAQGGNSRHEKKIAHDPVWHGGVEWLLSKGCKNVRPFLGQLCKDHGADAVVTAIDKARIENPVEPKAYLAKLLKTGGGETALAAKRFGDDWKKDFSAEELAKIRAAANGGKP